MSEISVNKIYEIIRPCGLAPQKSKAILELSKILCIDHSGKVPENFESLEKNSIDLYSAQKSIYLQSRLKKIQNSDLENDQDWDDLEK